MIPELLAGYFKTRHRFSRIVRSIRLSKDYFVLDVGSGDSPFAVADVLCEKYIWDDAERTAHIKRDRPTVAGDIENLPFKNNTFDFVHCSHVLEHAINPAKAISELQRVGKRGYIEVPTDFHEKTIKSHGGHLWFITLEGGRLIFRPKSSGILDAQLNEFVEQNLYEKDPWFQVFYYARLYKYYHIGLYWEGSIPYQIEGDVSSISDFNKASGDRGHVTQKLAREGSLVNILKRWLYKRKLRDVNIESIMACPNCRGLVKLNNAVYVCPKCQCDFPVVDGIPIMSKEATKTKPALFTSPLHIG